MPIEYKYNHIMVALETVLKGEKNTQDHKDATAVIRMHIKHHRERSMETAKISFS